MPECLKIEENILSDYQGHLLQYEEFNKYPPKLVLSLRNKVNYIIHCHNLKMYVDLWLGVTNVHHVLLFDQSPLLENYINFYINVNVQLRKMILKKIYLSW